MCTPIGIVLLVLLVSVIRSTCCRPTSATIHPVLDATQQSTPVETNPDLNIALSTKELGRDCYITVNPQSDPGYVTIAIIMKSIEKESESSEQKQGETT